MMDCICQGSNKSQQAVASWNILETKWACGFKLFMSIKWKLCFYLNFKPLSYFHTFVYDKILLAKFCWDLWRREVSTPIMLVMITHCTEKLCMLVLLPPLCLIQTDTSHSISQQLAMEFITGIHRAQRIYLTDFGVTLAFSLAPPWGLHLFVLIKTSQILDNWNLVHTFMSATRWL